MGIRKVLHPIKSSDGKYHEIKAAIFDMTKQEKEIFFSVLEKAKLPYGCAANISRYVHTKEGIISGYKSHNAHFVLHYLLQFAVKKTLKPEVDEPLIRLGAFLRATKVLKHQFVTTHQLQQQQQRTKKCTEVCSPTKSARLNNVPVKIPTEAKRYRKSGEGTEVTSTRKSARPISARPEINDMISKQKPKSTEKKGARKSTPINNQASDENVNLKSSSVRRKLDLHNPRDEDENTDENDIQIEDLPPPPPLESSLETIKKKLNSSEGVGGIEELVSGGKKSHGQGWLIGRHDSSLIKTSTQAPPQTDLYIEELTKKILKDLVSDMEAKLKRKVNEEVDAKVNQKVQDNLAIVLKKLVEANPSLHIDLGQICATVSSDTVGDGTQVTDGTSS
ncbi:hypothetical protein POM88_029370 [Heracleum sosnowskyi]|uniref:Uncharacterized protein n=1 Tax=Heracleum sosnowskyi TaxID=360622 RepID=A0AAD8HTH9_9APIA|nr:hypothetical protein POM88_029370 [Heracleum sosnowskyi]